MKGYLSKGVGNIVMVRINNKIRRYRIMRHKKKQFKIKVGKYYYTFKSAHPGSKITLKLI